MRGCVGLARDGAAYAIARGGAVWVLGGSAASVPEAASWDDPRLSGGGPVCVACVDARDIDTAVASLPAGVPLLAVDAFQAAVAGILLNPYGAHTGGVRGTGAAGAGDADGTERLAGRIGILLALGDEGVVCELRAGLRHGKARSFPLAPLSAGLQSVPAGIARKLGIPKEDLLVCGFGVKADSYRLVSEGLSNLAERYGFWDAAGVGGGA